MSFYRIAGLAGIVFIVLVVLNAVLLGNQPLADDSVSEVRDYISGDEGMHKTALFLGIVLLPFAVIFFAGLTVKLRESDRANVEGWGFAALAGAVLLGAGVGVGDAMVSALFFRSGEGLDDATIRVLWDAQLTSYAATGAAVATLTLSTAVPTLWHRIWPTWHGLLGIVVGVLGVLSLIGVVSDTNGGNAFAGIGFVAFAVWTLATSVLLLREPAAAVDPG
jgi:hypothetical protein